MSLSIIIVTWLSLRFPFEASHSKTSQTSALRLSNGLSEITCWCQNLRLRCQTSFHRAHSSLEKEIFRRNFFKPFSWSLFCSTKKKNLSGSSEMGNEKVFKLAKDKFLLTDSYFSKKLFLQKWLNIHHVSF